MPVAAASRRGERWRSHHECHCAEVLPRTTEEVSGDESWPHRSAPLLRSSLALPTPAAAATAAAAATKATAAPPRLKRRRDTGRARLLRSRAGTTNLSEPPNADSLPSRARHHAVDAISHSSGAAAGGHQRGREATAPACRARSRAARLGQQRQCRRGRALCRAAWRVPRIAAPVPPYLFAVARFWWGAAAVLRLVPPLVTRAAVDIRVPIEVVVVVDIDVVVSPAGIQATAAPRRTHRDPTPTRWPRQPHTPPLAGNKSEDMGTAGHAPRPGHARTYHLQVRLFNHDDVPAFNHLCFTTCSGWISNCRCLCFHRIRCTASMTSLCWLRNAFPRSVVH